METYKLIAPQWESVAKRNPASANVRNLIIELYFNLNLNPIWYIYLDFEGTVAIVDIGDRYIHSPSHVRENFSFEQVQFKYSLNMTKVKITS